MISEIKFRENAVAPKTGDGRQVWMVSDPTDLRIMSNDDAETLRDVMGNCDKEGLSCLLRARAQLIASQLVPGVWKTRTPHSTEVRIIIQDLTGPFFGMNPGRAIRLVVGAITGAGQWERFTEAFPQTAMVLQSCQSVTPN